MFSLCLVFLHCTIVLNMFGIGPQWFVCRQCVVSMHALHNLVVQGCVWRSATDMAAAVEVAVLGMGKRRLCTQIAATKMEEPILSPYDRRSWALWGDRLRRVECKGALASRQRVANSVNDRAILDLHAEVLLC